ncbi:MAG: patatin family protein [Deltaproteobacteria bacterium]|nr:patatin family protein [Deltaproteobacteria bacterium]MBN2687873.1 patatin family protein [Deltaproteobacteria bacterium]
MKSIDEKRPCTLKTALVVEGGAMRGIFSAGVLDTFIRERFDPFDILIGVSAGAGNIAAFLADMYRRNYKIYTDYSLRPEFMSWKKFLAGGNLINLDWLWKMTIRDVRLDLKKIFGKKKVFLIVATSVETGRAVYLQPDETTCEEYLKVSSALPFLYRTFPKVNGEKMTDGGIADSIPVIEAYRRGARTIMVLRSRPSDYVKKNSPATALYAALLRKYPNLSRAMRARAGAYMKSVAFINHPPPGVTVVDVCPPDGFETARLTKNLSVLERDYRIGRQEGTRAIERWNEAC